MASRSSGWSPYKLRKCEEPFKAEASRLASESRSTQAAAQQLGVMPKLFYRWRQTLLVAEVGSLEVARDPEVRALRQAPAGLIVDSDQDSQYAPTRFKDLLARHWTLSSISRRDNCHNSVHAESFWRRLKSELLDGSRSPVLESDSKSAATSPNATIPPWTI
ncbi:transposase [Hymenobacter sp. BT635]|uniref:Transposase n=1 Tax=Hymenobacter nitidus TaxID=2880929 RepID=A0ABS8AKP0_9BACT|nr:transposase [Hymenobacter nitidus]MCB2380436.1 transposase [Hymenobacter nitidus]